MTTQQILLAYGAGLLGTLVSVVCIRFGMWWGDRFG